MRKLRFWTIQGSKMYFVFIAMHENVDNNWYWVSKDSFRSVLVFCVFYNVPLTVSPWFILYLRSAWALSGLSLSTAFPPTRTSRQLWQGGQGDTLMSWKGTLRDQQLTFIPICVSFGSVFRLTWAFGRSFRRCVTCVRCWCTVKPIKANLGLYLYQLERTYICLLNTI